MPKPSRFEQELIKNQVEERARAYGIYILPQLQNLVLNEMEYAAGSGNTEVKGAVIGGLLGLIAAGLNMALRQDYSPGSASIAITIPALIGTLLAGSFRKQRLTERVIMDDANSCRRFLAYQDIDRELHPENYVR